MEKASRTPVQLVSVYTDIYMSLYQYNLSKTFVRTYIALTVLAPNVIADKYMKSIKQETYDLVSRFIETTETEGGIDPWKYLELSSMNFMFLACFGRKFNDIKDPEFAHLEWMIEKNMKYVAIENDLGNFFPSLSFINKFVDTHAEQEKYIKTERDPFYRRFVREALAREGPNVVKSLEENGYNFTEDEKLVFTCESTY